MKRDAPAPGPEGDCPILHLTSQPRGPLLDLVEESISVKNTSKKSLFGHKSFLFCFVLFRAGEEGLAFRFFWFQFIHKLFQIYRK